MICRHCCVNVSIQASDKLTSSVLSKIIQNDTMSNRCEKCNVTFYSSDGLNAHLERTHKIIEQKDNRVLDSFT